MSRSGLVPSQVPLHLIPLQRTGAENEPRGIESRAAWKASAACASGDPDALFVVGAAQREAARVCGGCPVKLECLADALDGRIEFGVWGGMTERQRRALLKRSPDVVSWRELLEEARDQLGEVAS